jgi:hypothetical protein
MKALYPYTYEEKENINHLYTPRAWAPNKLPKMTIASYFFNSLSGIVCGFWIGYGCVCFVLRGLISSEKVDLRNSVLALASLFEGIVAHNIHTWTQSVFNYFEP